MDAKKILLKPTLSPFFIFVLILISAKSIFAVCPTNNNLIVNGNAEADQSAPGSGADFDVSGWEPETGTFTVIRYGTDGGYPTISDPGPADRGMFFFAGGQAASSSGRQIIDLMGCAAQIDAGNLNFSLGGYLGGYGSDTDNTQITASFRNSADTTIATFSAGPVTPADRMYVTGLISRMTNGKIPFGTRTIEVTLLMTRLQGSDNDGYADNLSFTMFPSGNAGQIIYSRIPNNDTGTIWAINTDGTNDHQIASGNFPRLSPDGKFLIYRRKISTGTDVNYQASLYLLDLTTGTENIIYANNSDYIIGYDFAPNEPKIYLDYGCVIVKMDYNGANRQTLDSNCYDDAPASRKTDQMLTFHGFGGEIFTSNQDGSNRQAVPGTSGNNYYPFWSGDGQFIFYTHYDSSGAYPYSNDALYKIRPDGTGKVLVKSLTGTDRFGSLGTVSADNTKIYMPATIGGISGIYQVAVDGTGQTSLSPAANELIASGATVDFVSAVAPNIVTAAGASIRGRILSSNGKGIAGARITITGPEGKTRTVTANSFGSFNLDNLAVGASYVLQLSAKKYTFPQNPRVVTIVENLDAFNFVSNE